MALEIRPLRQAWAILEAEPAHPYRAVVVFCRVCALPSTLYSARALPGIRQYKACLQHPFQLAICLQRLAWAWCGRLRSKGGGPHQLM